MVARPTDIPTWATDATFPAGTDPWSGTPTRVEPDPGDAAAGFVPKAEPPAQWFNSLFGRLGDWMGYFAAIIDSDEEHTYQTPKTRELLIGPHGVADAGWVSVSGTGRVQSIANSALYAVTLSDHLRSGEQVSKVELLIKPAAARTGANRVAFSLWRAALSVRFSSPGDPSLTQLGTTQQDDGTTNYQVLTISGLAQNVSRWADTLIVFLLAGNDGATNQDFYYGLRVTFTDAGPRNA